MLQRREELRRNGGSVNHPEIPFGTDADMHRAGGLIQRRGAEREKMFGL